MSCPISKSNRLPTSPLVRLTLCDGDQPTIPKLEDYDVDPVHGFLPVNPPPLRRLPEPYGPWESMLDDLSALLLAGGLRKVVEKLPLLSTDFLASEREWQRAYLVLSFIGQAYVWGYNQDVAEILPMVIAMPWHSTAQHLGLKPVITYAAVELYNYRLLDPSGPYDLSNFAVMHSFTGNDESWFYLVSIATEAVGAPALSAIVAAMHAIVDEDLPCLNKSLDTIAEAIEGITKVMMRMYERNDPHIFYHRVRPYLAGWEHSSELPHGLFYEGVLAATTYSNKSPAERSPIHGVKGVFSNAFSTYNTVPSVEDIPKSGEAINGTYRKYAGASAGQSSMIHCLDVALGIEHNPTKTARCTSAQVSNDSLTDTCPVVDPTTPPINHIHEMRKYMPGSHRAFIQALERGPSIRQFVHDIVNHPMRDMDNTPGHDPAVVDEVSRLYNRCVEGMRTFRDRHLQIVATYIVLQAKKRKEVGHFDRPPGSASTRVRQSLQARGTGGTDLIPFLKQSRDETSEARVQLEI
ncbi:Indoleamine 2,3-dioxygenase [Powellomyces hirtus]|nr:Indoleamine 2,3-dioxygenase [Powellomyces hirtus]